MNSVQIVNSSEVGCHHRSLSDYLDYALAMLFQFIQRRYSASREDIDDMVYVVILIFLRKLHRFNETEILSILRNELELDGWIRGVARHVISHTSRRKAVERRYLQFRKLHFSEPQVCDVATPMLRDKLSKVLSGCAKQDLLVAELVMRGNTQSAISQTLGIHRSTVRRCLDRIGTALMAAAELNDD
jgi:DNA-directed RNA polymerase specialized sigma24 family protein